MNPEEFSGFLVVIGVIFLIGAVFYWRALLVGGLILGGGVVIFESALGPVEALVLGLIWVVLVVKLFGTK